MFAEFADARDWSRYAFVIVGSGFAGQFLAEKLSRSGRVLLLEAGGRDNPLALGNGYYELESDGMQIPALGARLSAFGGTSGHWTAQTHPLSPAIFKDRPGMPGWPIFYEDFALHLPEALEWFGLPPFYPPGAVSSLERGLFADQADLAVLQFQVPDPIPRLGKAERQRSFSLHEHIDVLTDTRLVDMTLAPGGGAVASIDLVHGASRERRTIPVRSLILCTGGIENPRLMLWAGRKYPPGNPFLGGPNALTGKFYTDHPAYRPADIYFDGRADLSDGLTHEQRGQFGFSMWLPSDAIFERERLPRFAILLHEMWRLAADDPDAEGLDPDFLAATPLLTGVRPIFKFEQTPHEGSRVTLTDSLDRDGVAKAHLQWEFLPSDFAAYRQGTILMCELLGQKGFARSRLRPDYRSEDWSGIKPAHSAHHTGTTRMGHSPSLGVVDRNCRVFGLDNLYVAGSSVFPTGDYLNPTLNIVAMTARLAHFLQAKPEHGYSWHRYGDGRWENAQLVGGWSHPEEYGIWSDGAEAVLKLARNGARTMTIWGHGFRHVGIRIAINGVERYCGLGFRHMCLSFELDGASDLEMTIAFSNLRSPKDYGESDDERLLGFFLERIQLR